MGSRKTIYKNRWQAGLPIYSISLNPAQAVSEDEADTEKLNHLCRRQTTCKQRPPSFDFTGVLLSWTGTLSEDLSSLCS